MGGVQSDVAIWVTKETVLSPNVVAIGEESGASATDIVGACQGVYGAAFKRTLSIQEATIKAKKEKKKRSFKSLPSTYNHTNPIGPSRHYEGNFILHNKDCQILPQPLAMVLLTRSFEPHSI